MSKINLQMKQLWSSLRLVYHAGRKTHLEIIQFRSKTSQAFQETASSPHSVMEKYDSLAGDSRPWWFKLKITKRWPSWEVVLGPERRGDGGSCWWGWNLSAFCAKTMFALARCAETICHYMSKCKTRAPCIVMCHLFKLLGPLDGVLPVMWHRPGPQDAHTDQCQNYQSAQVCSN